MRRGRGRESFLLFCTLSSLVREYILTPRSSILNPPLFAILCLKASPLTMSSQATRVLSGYRRLFRARKCLFEGDTRAMRESKVAIRKEFDKNRRLTDPNHLEGLLVMIDEAEDMLLNGIVRGELNKEKNVYEVKIKKEHAANMDKETITHIDPITAETSNNESSHPNVVVTSTSGKKNST
jgi:hypothetical protein